MPTWNYELQHLTVEEIHACSERFLRGWHDPMADGHKFRIKGLNARRLKLGLPPLTKDWSVQYRIDYVKTHFSEDVIIETLEQYLSTHLMDSERWTGINLFDCHFGRDYVKVFKGIVGSSVWRKLSELTRRQKLVATQMELYGGVGVGNKVAYDKMIHTKASKIIHNMVDVDVDETMFDSKDEFIVWQMLVAKFGRADVFYQYGVHPYDARYPYPCDFYIKSQDLFIEMHIHYAHHVHWYDAENKDDRLRAEQILTHGSDNAVKMLNTWMRIDIEKREKARSSDLKYLVFWDGKHLHADIPGDRVRHYVPRLADFHVWYDDYNCDYESFVAAHPENTY